jgi:hypothetical protein
MVEKPLSKEFLLRAVVMFVIIAGGVFAGLALGVRLGLGSSNTGFDPHKELPEHLSVGRPFPDLEVRDSVGVTVDLAKAVSDGKQIVAFVSPTCGPCQNLVTFLAQAPSVQAGSFQVALVSTDPDAFPHFQGARFYRIYGSTLDSLGVKLFPTMVGVEHGQIAYAQGTFDPNRRPKFFTSDQF